MHVFELRIDQSCMLSCDSTVCCMLLLLLSCSGLGKRTLNSTFSVDRQLLNFGCLGKLVAFHSLLFFMLICHMDWLDPCPLGKWKWKVTICLTPACLHCVLEPLTWIEALIIVPKQYYFYLFVKLLLWFGHCSPLVRLTSLDACIHVVKHRSFH